MPKVMDVLTRLTTHPALRYTATLIVGRYADWLNHHPNFIEPLLTFVVGGFKDKEVCCMLHAVSLCSRAGL
jgi:transportin-3